MILVALVSSNCIQTQTLILKNWYSFCLLLIFFSFISDTSVIRTQTFVNENFGRSRKAKTVGLSGCILFFPQDMEEVVPVDKLNGLFFRPQAIAG